MPFTFTKLVVLYIVFLFLSVVETAGAEISPSLRHQLSTTAPNEEIAVIVTLNDSIELHSLKALDRTSKRKILVQSLKKHARTTQKDLKRFIRSKSTSQIKTLWIINSLAIKAKPSLIAALSQRPEVQEVRIDTPIILVNNPVSITSTTQWNLSMVGADLMWNQGFLGQGVVIGSMDTGVDYLHSSLSGNWRGGSNSWYDPHGEHLTPYDADGHGTQVTGIMAGSPVGGSEIGMAPQSEWIAVKAFADNGSSSSSVIHQGFQWFLDPDGDPLTDDLPDIVNNSWGYPETVDSCDTEFLPDIQLLRELGVHVVFSGGNLGAGPSSISPPNNPGSFSVGAVDETGLITIGSSHGPSACDGGIYPTTVAPGNLVRTADLSFNGFFPDSTVLSSGTSFAAPHVSGAMALLLNALPDTSLADLETALNQTAVDLGDPGPDNIYGNGLINVADAYTYLSSLGQCTDYDNDGYFLEEGCGTVPDCDDNNPDIYPDATEIKHDGIDQDCNGYDLTIDINRAIYFKHRDLLLVTARSSLGAEALLEVEITGLGVRSMRYLQKRQLWIKVLKNFSQGTTPGNLPQEVSVFGPEGQVSSPITPFR